MARTIYVPQADEFIDFSDTATDAQIQSWIRAKYPKPAPPPPTPPPAPPEEGVGALESGFYGSLGRLEAAGGMAAQATGLESLAEYLFNKSRESEEYAAKYKPDVADISEIEGVGDVAKFAGSTIAQSAPETAVGIGGALVGASVGALGGPAAPVTIPIGALIGSALASLPFFIGGNLQRQLKSRASRLRKPAARLRLLALLRRPPLTRHLMFLSQGSFRVPVLLTMRQRNPSLRRSPQ